MRHACNVALLVLASSLALPLAAAPGTTFQVTASIVPGCMVVGGGTNYGTLSYGSFAASTVGPVSTALTGGVQLQCTPGVTLSMSIGGGQNSGSGSDRNLKSGSELLPYQLYSDIGLSQALPVGQSVNVAYTNANNIRLPIYGRVVLPGNVPAGTYTDVVQVQLTW